MKSQCESIRHELFEGAAGERGLSRDIEAHLEHCDDCRRFVATEGRLADLLMNAMPPGDSELQEKIITAVRKIERRNRWFVPVPAAVACVMMLGGLVLLGGLPGRAGLAEAGTGARSGWALLTSMLSDGSSVLQALATAVSQRLPLSVAVGSLTAAVAGVVLTLWVWRRWQRRLECSDER